MLIDKFEDLKSWQEARKLTKDIYSISRAVGFSKDFRLASQIQAASVSVMSNIAEGFGRSSKKYFSRFLSIAYSSAVEVQSQLYVALDQSYVDQAKFTEVYNQVNLTKKLVAGMIRRLKVEVAA